MKKSLDARGLPCPKPVVMTKKMLEDGGFEALDILVDNAAAKENVSRFLKKQGYEDIRITEDDQGYTVHIGESSPAASPSRHAQVKDKTLLLTSSLFRSGDEELGRLLMRGFIYSLRQIDSAPARIICINSAVYLACEGSPVLEDLQHLVSDGVELLVCGTCLDYYQLKGKMHTGIISNMYTIAEMVMESASTIKIS
jgi:selenium metabolism protein YedF